MCVPHTQVHTVAGRLEGWGRKPVHTRYMARISYDAGKSCVISHCFSPTVRWILGLLNSCVSGSCMNVSVRVRAHIRPRAVSFGAFFHELVVTFCL